jgi:hypothetical protein
VSFIRRAAVAGATLAVGLHCLPALARAGTLIAPKVSVRQLNPDDYTAFPGRWMSFGAPVTSLGPYELGIAIQPISSPGSRQAVEVDLVSAPPGPVDPLYPLTPYCHLVAGGVGTVQGTGDILEYRGNGTYTLAVSVYTDTELAAFQAQGVNTCSGGPATMVTLTVAAGAAPRIVGTPIVPRTGAVHGFIGFQFTAPSGDQGYRWRCARNPVVASDGSVSGTTTVSDRDPGEARGTVPIAEGQAFSGPGRWACAVQLVGGDSSSEVFTSTPWEATPAVTVKGQYARDPTRTRLAHAGRHRLSLIVPSVRSIAPFAAGGRLSFALYRAVCRHGRVLGRRIARSSGRVNDQGAATFSFTTPQTEAFYFGRVSFGGTSLVLRGADPAPLLFQARQDPRRLVAGATLFGFVDPTQYAPCA